MPMHAPTKPRPPTTGDIAAAARRIASFIRRTPLLTSDALNRELGCQIWLKCEHLQETGAFKMRGAANAVQRLREQGITADVATHSSGNHGAALARAARLDGRRAHIVMPDNAVRMKIDAVRRQGGEVILCAPTQAAREAGLAELVEQGLVPVPPYDHHDIIAGQGTATLELLEEAGALDVLLAPVGGGGLISGTAIAAHGVNPEIEVIAAEPDGAADTAASLARGRRVTEWQPNTIADGLRALVGVLTFEIIQSEVARVLTVSDQAIIEGMQLAKEALDLAIEPSSATVLAAIRAHPAHFRGLRVGVILSGGNVDTSAYPFLAGGE